MITFGLDFELNYGINGRAGWSVAIDGIYWVEFWPEPITAIVVAFWRKWRSKVMA